MKAKDLIALLQQLPDYADVLIDTHDENGDGEYADFTLAMGDNHSDSQMALATITIQ